MDLSTTSLNNFLIYTQLVDFEKAFQISETNTGNDFSSLSKNLTNFLSQNQEYFYDLSKKNIRQSSRCILQLKRLINKISLLAASHVDPKSKVFLTHCHFWLSAVATHMGNETVVSHRIPLKSKSIQNMAPISLGKTLDSVTLTDEGLIQKFESKQAEVFHLIAEEIKDCAELNAEEIDKMSGSSEITAYLNYLAILKAWINQTDVSYKDGLKQIREKLKFACQIAIKLQEIERKATPSTSTPFDLASHLFKSSSTQLSESDILLNHICHDSLEKLQSIEVNDFIFFSAGTFTHSVLILITRVSETIYNYMIFNTGVGVEEFHDFYVLNGKELIMPLTFSNIEIEKLNYLFFKKLFEMHHNKSSSIEEFYQFHREHLFNHYDELTDQQTISSLLYKAQSFGTCTYSCIDQSIEVLLRTSQLEELIEEKNKFKRQRALDILEKIEAESLEDREWSRLLPGGLADPLVKQTFHPRHIKLVDMRKLSQKLKNLIQLGKK